MSTDRPARAAGVSDVPLTFRRDAKGLKGCQFPRGATEDAQRLRRRPPGALGRDCVCEQPIPLLGSGMESAAARLQFSPEWGYATAAGHPNTAPVRATRWAARLFRYPEWSGLEPTEEGCALTPAQGAAFLNQVTGEVRSGEELGWVIPRRKYFKTSRPAPLCAVRRSSASRPSRT